MAASEGNFQRTPWPPFDHPSVDFRTDGSRFASMPDSSHACAIAWRSASIDCSAQTVGNLNSGRYLTGFEWLPWPFQGPRGPRRQSRCPPESSARVRIAVPAMPIASSYNPRSMIRA
jgi:hypothetical protein